MRVCCSDRRGSPGAKEGIMSNYLSKPTSLHIQYPDFRGDLVAVWLPRPWHNGSKRAVELLSFYISHLRWYVLVRRKSRTYFLALGGRRPAIESDINPSHHDVARSEPVGSHHVTSLDDDDGRTPSPISITRSPDRAISRPIEIKHGSSVRDARIVLSKGIEITQWWVGKVKRMLVIWMKFISSVVYLYWPWRASNGSLHPAVESSHWKWHLAILLFLSLLKMQLRKCIPAYMFFCVCCCFISCELFTSTEKLWCFFMIHIWVELCCVKKSTIG